MGTDIRTECTNDKIRLSHPQLADPIQEKSYKELIWTVDDPEKQGQDKQKLVYCNEYFKCHKYNITGRYQQRIETTAAVRGVLYIKQKKFNDKLTYTCRVIQKGNKPPCDYTITVSSSANCEWIKLNTWIGSVFPFSRLAVALASWGEGGGVVCAPYGKWLVPLLLICKSAGTCSGKRSVYYCLKLMPCRFYECALFGTSELKDMLFCTVDLPKKSGGSRRLTRTACHTPIDITSSKSFIIFSWIN